MLSLEQNELEHIGRSLYRLKKIDNINLYDNRIQDIDLNEFSKLPLLRKLEMGRSGFTFATTKIEVREIYNNTELHYLYISNNDLSDARELSKLRIFPFLKFLDLSNNLYENLDVGSNQTLKDILPRLESLDFTDTSIECRNMVAVSREFGSAEIEHLCYFWNWVLNKRLESSRMEISTWAIKHLISKFLTEYSYYYYPIIILYYYYRTKEKMK